MHVQSAKYHLRKAESGEEDRWEQFVAENQLPLFFGLKWARLIRSLTGRSFSIIFIEADEQLYGGFLYWAGKKKGLRSATPVPFTPYSGLVLKQESGLPASTRIAREAQINGLVAAFLQKHFDFVRFPAHPALHDIRPYLWAGFEARPLYTYRFALNGNESEHYNSTLKRQIRKGEKEGLTVQTDEDSTALVEFVRASYRAHGLNPPLPAHNLRRFAEALLKEKLGYLFYVLNAQNQKIGAVLLTMDQTTVYYTLSGIDRAYRHLNPMAFLLNTAFQNESLRGREFDFIGANTPALDQFKRGFGGKLVPYYRLSCYANRFVKTLVRLNEIGRHRRKGRG